MKTIYTLHEYGAPSHFMGLEQLARREGYVLKHREIRQGGSVKKFIAKFSLKIFTNIFFLISLPFRSKAKVVLAVAPFYSHISTLMFLLKRHEVYYFTSYTKWSPDMKPHPHPLRSDSKHLSQWKYFTNSFVKHIFAVSAKTKEELIINGFASSNRISVVNHSIRNRIKAGEQKNSLRFIQVGRLVPYKGVMETIDFFKSHPSFHITFAGRGILQADVEMAASKYKNIDSKILLKLVYDIIKEKGYYLGNLDAIVFLEAPKLKPHVDEIIKTIASIISEPIEKISVKATTFEKLGPIGESKAIAAECVCILLPKTV